MLREPDFFPWPVQTPRAVMMARVEARAAQLRRRRRMAVGLPVALAAIIAAAATLPRELGTSTLRTVPPASRPGGEHSTGASTVDGGLHRRDNGQGADSQLADPVSSDDLAPAVHAGAGVPGPFVPSHRADGLPLGQILMERDNAIVAMFTDGTGERVVASADAGLVEPHWAPDGRRFVARDLAFRIVVVEADGSMKAISPVGELASMPRWSPDGSRILYQASDGLTGTHLRTMKPDGTDGRLVARDAVNADWSADSTEIVHQCVANTICISAADGTGTRVLASNFSSPRWSPNGSRIVAMRTGDSAWVTMAPNGSDQRVAVTRVTASIVEWSADGGWLGFATSETADDCLVGCTRTAVWAMRADGTAEHRVTDRGGRNPAFGRAPQTD